MVNALQRQVESAGGFATVLASGSRYGSALLLVTRTSETLQAHERIPSVSGDPDWRLAAEGESEVADFISRQRRFDPDLWVLELDVAAPERFVAGLAGKS